MIVEQTTYLSGGGGAGNFIYIYIYLNYATNSFQSAPDYFIVHETQSRVTGEEKNVCLLLI